MLMSQLSDEKIKKIRRLQERDLPQIEVALHLQRKKWRR